MLWASHRRRVWAGELVRLNAGVYRREKAGVGKKIRVLQAGLDPCFELRGPAKQSAEAKWAGEKRGRDEEQGSGHAHPRRWGG